VSNATGRQIFIQPLNLTTPFWHGKVVEVGALAENYSNINECDPVKYKISDIEGITNFGNTLVHIVLFDKLTKDYPKEEGSE
jgi:hypothetical protein